MKSFVWFLTISLAFLVASRSSADSPKAKEIDFETMIQPIIESTCLHCHNEKRAEGELRLDSRALATKGGTSGPALVPKNAEKSPLYALTVLKAGDDKKMPPEGAPLSEGQAEIIKTWIAQGANWPETAKMQEQPRVDFVKHVQPILEMNCVSCHQMGHAEGHFDLSSPKKINSGDNAPSIVAFDVKNSALYGRTILSKDDDQLMPPKDKGGPLDKATTETLRMWIAQGAVWPDNVTLKVRAKEDKSPPTPDTLELVKKIRETVIAKSKVAGDGTKPDGKMESYASKIPRTGATYHMVAIPAGEFMMGSPDGEAKRDANEGPQQRVKVDGLWIGKYEVTWDEYEPFMLTKADRAKNGMRMDYDPKKHDMIDAVSQPTKPYVEMSFGMGQTGYPAISMTQHGANKYCQWLSAQTGHFYRLPTEAEWEYACRAGTTTAYSFGDETSKLGEYAWYYDNSNEKYQKVGLKKPNPWGLHDMHGNAMEWTADQFLPDRYARKPAVTDNPFVKPQTLYPRAVRGGNWDDDPEKLRSAARRGSDESWKIQDPQLPKSIWYFTDAKGLGFRIIRPAKVPSAEEMFFYWNSEAGKQ